MVRFLYTLFVGLLVATSIGIGISAFYPSPKAPEYPPVMEGRVPQKSTEPAVAPADQATADAYEIAERRYQTQREDYNRNVALISTVFAILILVLSLTWAKRFREIADGLLLGGVFTLIYGIIRSFESGEQKFMFVVVIFGLAVAIALGYIKFIQPAASQPKPKSKKA